MMLILIVEHHGKQNLIIYACKKFSLWEDRPYLHTICLFTPLCKPRCRGRDKKATEMNFVGRKRWKVYSGSEKMRNASSHQGENERQWKIQTWKNTYKISSLIKHGTWKFHVVVMQNNNSEMYKGVCCISKVVFLLIMTYGFFCRSHCWSLFSATWFYFLFEYKYINESFAFS